MNLEPIIAAVQAPTGMWASLINWVHSFVGGYGWTILVLIIFVKLVLSPFDYLIKHSSKKTSLMQKKLAPQMTRLKIKYGNNSQMIQTQTQALYKREGYNVFGSCIVMLLNLVLTSVIFFTLFAGLRDLSSYQAISQYHNIHDAYVASVTQSYDGNYEEYKIVLEKLSKNEEVSEDEKAKVEAAVKEATEVVQAKWHEEKQSWLWIKNIWVTDGHASPFPSLAELQKMANNSKKADYKADVNEIINNPVLNFNYTQISGMIVADTGDWNGYYLLAVISVVLSVATMMISDLSTKSKNKKSQQVVDAANPQAKSMWFMKLLVPVMMAIFVFTTNSAFGIYVITNSLMSTIIGLITNLIVSKVFRKKEAEVEEELAKEALKLEKRNGRVR